MFSYFTARKQIAFKSDLRDYRVSSTGGGGGHVTFALGSWEDAAGSLSKSTEFWIQILCCLFSGLWQKKKKPHDLWVYCYLERTINFLLYVILGVVSRKNPTVNSRSGSEANSGMCCFFQGLFLIEVRGICLPTWELKVLASTTAWKECGQTWVCHFKCWDWEF